MRRPLLLSPLVQPQPSAPSYSYFTSCDPPEKQSPEWAFCLLLYDLKETEVNELFPVNMPDPIRKRFGYGQLWPLRPACSQNRAGSYMPDPTSRIFFSSFFQRRHGPYYTKPTRIRSEWPGQGLAKHIWSESKLVGRNHRARFLAERNRPATSFPYSDSVAFFHRRPGQ